MCTVTFAATNNSVIITSNRDENIDRATTAMPTIHQYNTHQIIHPTDGKAKGTWIGVNNNNTIAVLLNGALHKHTKATNYVRSRGYIIPAILQTNNAALAMAKLNLLGVEPFTVLLLEATYLYLYRWNGTALSTDLLSESKYHIFSSATLYNSMISHHKNTAFQNYTNNTIVNKESIMNFHQSQYYENWLPSEAAKNNIKTISTSQIVVQNNTSTFSYYDYVSNKVTVSNFNNNEVAAC